VGGAPTTGYLERTMMSLRTYLGGRARTFYHAGVGLGCLVREEHNARIHLFVTVVVIAAGWYVSLTPAEWSNIAICIALVWSAEAVNSALERVADVVSPDQNATIGAAKDLAAAAVLMAALGAAIVGSLVFYPHLVR